MYLEYFGYLQGGPLSVLNGIITSIYIYIYLYSMGNRVYNITYRGYNFTYNK